MRASRHKRNRQKMAGASMALLITALFAATFSLVLWKRTAAGKYAAMEMDTNARPAGEKELPPDPEAILEQIREKAVSVLRLTASRISLHRRRKEICVL